MLDAVEMQGWLRRLEGLLARKFGAKEGTLPERLRKVGRDLPARIRRDIKTVIEASKVAAHPKLRVQHDYAQVRAAYERAEKYLKDIDIKDRAKGRALSLLSTVLFNLVLFVILAAVFLAWRGFL